VGKTNHWNDLGVDGSITIKYILNNSLVYMAYVGIVQDGDKRLFIVHSFVKLWV
jgi:hypothetical protein